MDAVKNAVGLGQKTQEGQEPVSGQQGAGTAGEPFDAGNKEGTADNAALGGKAPQETDPSQVTGETSTAADSAAASGGKLEAPAPATASEPSKAGSSSDDNDSSEKPAIGSAAWFKTAQPQTSEAPPPHPSGNDVAAVDSHNADSNPTRQTSSPNAMSHQDDDQKHHSTTGGGLLSSLNPFSESKDNNNNDPQHSSEDSRDMPTTSTTDPPAPTEEPSPAAASGPRASTLPGTNDPIKPEKPDYREQSLKPAENPKFQPDRQAHGSNPSAIPTAGGTRIGSVAMEDRERRRSSIAQASRPSVEPPRSGSEAISESAGNSESLGGGGADKPEMSADAAEAGKTSNVPGSTADGAAAGGDAEAESPSPSRSGGAAGKEKENRRSSGALEKLKGKLHLGHHHKE